RQLASSSLRSLSSTKPPSAAQKEEHRSRLCLTPGPLHTRTPEPEPDAGRRPEPEPDAGRPSPLAGARARRRSPSPTAAAAEQAGGRNGRFARESTDDSSANRPGHVEELAADVARRVRLALSGLRASRARSSSFTGSSSSRSPASPASSAPPPARRSTPA